MVFPQDWYNSDLELEINTNDFCSARANSKVGFAYIWAGARATHGATMGKVTDNEKIELKVIIDVHWGLGICTSTVTETPPDIVTPVYRDMIRSF